jgi:hypothetical protein
MLTIQELALVGQVLPISAPVELIYILHSGILALKKAILETAVPTIHPACCQQELTPKGWQKRMN